MARGRHSETIEIKGHLLKVSGSSIRVRIDGQEHILPTSQIDWSETGKTDDEGNDEIEINIPDWLAIDRGLA